MSEQGYVVVHLSEIPENEPGPRPWLPVRHHVGARAFGANVWIAHEPGTRVLDEHTEENGDDELYFVVSGRATFTVGGDEVEAPEGTFVFVRAGTNRTAFAAEPKTTIFAVGAPPGRAYVPSLWELWFPAYRKGEYDVAAEVARKALADQPDEPRLLFNLACFESLGGRREEAIAHLRRAVELDPSFAENARKDSDFDPIRGDPAFPA